MKVCCGCCKEKPESAFGNHRGGLRSRCKECRKAYDREAYQRLDTTQNRVAKIRRRNRLFLWKHYAQSPCIDCGESDPIVLDSHHVKGEKLANVAQLAHNTRSLKVIKQELAKCVTLCSNCHRRRTAIQQGWYKEILGDQRGN